MTPVPMLESRRFKSAAYEQLARVGKSVSSPKRLELLDLLSQGPRTVEALARHTDQSVANVSAHLQVLRAARLVDAEKEGLYVTYRLASDEVAGFLLALRGLAESRLLEVAHITREFLEERGAFEPIDREALIEKIRGGRVTVLDVRPSEEYEAGHIPGAVSIPLGELKKRLSALPRSREVVAYCRGPFCVLAIEAVELLRARGFRAVRMDEGVVEWRARGLKVETSPARMAP